MSRSPYFAVFGLAVTQLLGWMTTFNTPAVLGSAIADELSVPVWMTFAGVSVFLVAMALASPVIGRFYKRVGAARIMTIGSFAGAVLLVGVAASPNLPIFLIFFCLLGIVGAAVLTTSANTLLVQLPGDAGRKLISAIMLISGLSSSVGFPITSLLLEAIGWRETFLVFALLHLIVCAPIHAFLGVFYPFDKPKRIGGAEVPEPKPDRHERRLFFWLVISVSLVGIVTWGFAVAIIEFLQDAGLTSGEAIFLASLIGVFQVMARAVEFLFGQRLQASLTALMSSLALALVFLLPVAISSYAAMAFFVFVYGAASGTMSVARATMALEFFDRTTYGSVMSKLALPMTLAFAIAPPMFGALLDRYGVVAPTIVAAIMSFMTALALFRLRKLAAGRAAPLGAGG